jgi:gamma-glutamyl phosphate reductase
MSLESEMDQIFTTARNASQTLLLLNDLEKSAILHKMADSPKCVY